MKIVKTVFLYVLAAFYIGMGVMHIMKPNQYLGMMPTWLPFQLLLIYGSGVVEISSGVLLIPVKTRVISARLIIAMLVVYFFAIHIPQSIDYYKTGNKAFVASLIRLPFQFVLIAWAWVYAKPKYIAN